MRLPKHLYITIIAALFLLISVLAFRSYLPYVGNDMVSAKPPSFLIKMDDVYLVGLGSKGKAWSTKAKTLEISQDRVTSTLTGITDGSAYDGEKALFNLKAGKAVYNTFYKDLMLGEGVAINTPDGQKITGRGVCWNYQTFTLRSNGGIVYQNKYGKVMAGNMIYNLRSRELLMQKVNMKVNLAGAEKFLSEGQ